MDTTDAWLQFPFFSFELCCPICRAGRCCGASSWTRRAAGEMVGKLARIASSIAAALALIAVVTSFGGWYGPAVLPEETSHEGSKVAPAVKPAAHPLPARHVISAAQEAEDDGVIVGSLLKEVSAIRKALLTLQAREEARQAEGSKSGVSAKHSKVGVKPAAEANVSARPGAESSTKTKRAVAAVQPSSADADVQEHPQEQQRTARRGGEKEGKPLMEGYRYGLQAHAKLVDSQPLPPKQLDLGGTAPYWASALDAGPERDRLEAGTDRLLHPPPALRESFRKRMQRLVTGPHAAKALQKVARGISEMTSAEHDPARALERDRVPRAAVQAAARAASAPAPAPAAAPGVGVASAATGGRGKQQLALSKGGGAARELGGAGEQRGAGAGDGGLSEASADPLNANDRFNAANRAREQRLDARFRSFDNQLKYHSNMF